jgi:2-polyprenyl-3-methyl-5-hydroxy-6-metoxy-1,4-benzoquinol methylase
MGKRTLRNPWLATRNRTGSEYDAPYEARAAAGLDVHGEAALVEKLLYSDLNQTASSPPYRVLDAGCGTGRTAIELARRGINVVGVDMDEVMLSHARQKAPQLDWRLADLSSIELHASFDVIVMAGNVMIFLTPGTEAAIVANMARHLKPGGLLIAAFELTAPPWSLLTPDAYKQWTQAAALTPVARWSTWEQLSWSDDDSYAVMVHIKRT